MGMVVGMGMSDDCLRSLEVRVLGGIGLVGWFGERGDGDDGLWYI